MKKLFLMLMVALAVVACNKNETDEPEAPSTTTETEGPQEEGGDTFVITPSIIADQFKELSVLIGMDKAAAESALTKNGWTDYGGTFVMLTDFSMSQVTFTTNESNVVYEMNCAIFPDTTKVGKANYKPTMNCNYIKNMIANIGETFELGQAKTACRFYMTYNSTYYVLYHSAQEFCGMVTDAFLNDTKTVYLDSSISHWDPQNPTTFVGASLGCSRYPLPDVTETEYRVSIRFANETLMQ